MAQSYRARLKTQVNLRRGIRGKFYALLGGDIPHMNARARALCFDRPAC
jgi:hypothetical protein